MTNRELVLRFCAFHERSFEEYAEATSLDTFLLDYTRSLDRRSESVEGRRELELLKTTFYAAMRNAATVLGKGAFRQRALGEAKGRGQINRAILESQALALAPLTHEQASQHAKALQHALRALFQDQTYDTAVRAGTGDVRRVTARLTMAADAVRRVVQ